MPEKVFKNQRNVSKRARTFIAIPLPAELKDKIAALVARLESQNRSVTWQDPQKTHITLMFLGHIAQERVDAAAKALKETALTFSNFQLKTGNLDYLYTSDEEDNSALHISVVDSEKQLWELYKDLAKRLAAEGFYPPERLNPHITIGRIKKHRDRNIHTQTLDTLVQDKSLVGKTIPVETLNMYERLQQRGGLVRYRLLRSYSLR
ncbi:MAG: 2'-5' RNA ligase [Candidatus Blackburnbacteria bacterium RIFCSPHIGHO2_01_FULL_43_15b]|uniref:RNA 2',3'-cyclic phosphodiesterase n=1 Tax=Candidatus Blackburnbacteria bacterium RIFCSPHIGHO2_01_FULL_43_15b TaxID=1797513 RepID=A0A1G1V1L9_9BACT|nr:MAG: 2'-5' RNA ligase [Candidatus Blackburnbacteria bacterium RIFCSPHIGHO2_01_FULL_43_15b]